MHTDINRKGWIEKLPVRTRPYAYLARLDRPVGVWLLLLPAWWAIALAAGGVAAMNAADWNVMALFGIGAVVMRGAGCVMNDLWDRKLDRQVARTAARPLAAGDISVTQALIFLVILLVIGFVILLQLSLVAVLLGILVVPLIAVYPLMKRVTWWPQAFLGLTFNFGVLMGWAAISGLVALPALLLYAGGIFWTLGYDTVYAHQDKEDDARIGIKSTALKLGDSSAKVVAGFYGVCMALITAAFISVDAGVLSLLLLALPAGYLFQQMKNWNSDDPESSLQAFKSARNFGFLVVLAAGC